jgi:hypothetical protein
MAAKQKQQAVQKNTKTPSRSSSGLGLSKPNLSLGGDTVNRSSIAPRAFSPTSTGPMSPAPKMDLSGPTPETSSLVRNTPPTMETNVERATPVTPSATVKTNGVPTKVTPMSDLRQASRADRAAERASTQAQQDKYATALERAKQIGEQNTKANEQASASRYYNWRAESAQAKYDQLSAQVQREKERGGSARDASRRAEQYKVQAEVNRRRAKGEEAPFFSWEKIKMPDGGEYKPGWMGQYERVVAPPISRPSQQSSNQGQEQALGGTDMRNFLSERGLQSTQKNWDNYVPMEEAQKMYRTDMDQQALGSTPVFTEAPKSGPSNFSLPKFNLSGIPSPSTSQMAQGLQPSMPNVSGTFSNQTPPTPSLTKMTNDQELNRMKSQTSRPYGSAMFGVPSAPPFPQWGVA